MIEIIGTRMSENSLIGDCVGAAVGALLIASTLYIVSKIKQRMESSNCNKIRRHPLCSAAVTVLM